MPEGGNRDSEQATTGITTWRPTDRWRPARSGTAHQQGAYECVETKEVGLRKTASVAQEKLCSELGRAIDIPVPAVSLGRVEGQNQIDAFSIAHGKESLDIGLLRLGILVAAVLPGRLAGVAIVGWEPNPEQPPAELRSVGPLGLSQLVGWVPALARNILEEAKGAPEEVFESLAGKWRWNLYVTEPEEFVSSANARLVDVARRLYEKYADEDFPSPPVVRRSVHRASVRRRWAPAELEFALPVEVFKTQMEEERERVPV